MTTKAREALEAIKDQSGQKRWFGADEIRWIIAALSDAGQLRNPGAIEKCPKCDREWAGAFPGCHIVTDDGDVIKCPIKQAGDG